MLPTVAQVAALEPQMAAKPVHAATVVAAMPPSYLDLVDKAIRAACAYRPITDAEVAKLRAEHPGVDLARLLDPDWRPKGG